ncbi:MAG: hypothetical protein LC122_13005 [Chitinophagales bacterium]|nr:hypothetical protein [Chitinophagales bacterium]
MFNVAHIFNFKKIASQLLKVAEENYLDKIILILKNLFEQVSINEFIKDFKEQIVPEFYKDILNKLSVDNKTKLIDLISAELDLEFLSNIDVLKIIISSSLFNNIKHTILDINPNINDAFVKKMYENNFFIGRAFQNQNVIEFMPKINSLLKTLNIEIEGNYDFKFNAVSLQQILNKIAKKILKKDPIKEIKSILENEKFHLEYYSKLMNNFLKEINKYTEHKFLENNYNYDSVVVARTELEEFKSKFYTIIKSLDDEDTATYLLENLYFLERELDGVEEALTMVAYI